MRKEVVFAIVFGLILGGVIIFGIRFANKAVQTVAPISPSPTPLTNNQPISPTPEQSLLTISSPTNNSVVGQSSITITGKTFPNAIIAATSNEYESISQSDKDGTFSLILSLSGGENQIKIESKTSDGKSANTNLLIIYTTAKIEL